MAGRILYWVAVLAISLLLVIGLIIFIESRDDSSLEDSGRPGTGVAAVI